MKNEKTVVDIDYAEAIVPKSARRGIVTMFMIMLGFTFFSASMWVGQQLADGLDFQGFVVSMIVGGVIKLIPLTGVTMPYISYGGSSMLSCMLMLGILQGVSVAVGEQEEAEWRLAREVEEA